MTRTKYSNKKAMAREKAMAAMEDFTNANRYWSETTDLYDFIYRLGKRYGLLKEFKKNGLL